MVVSAPFGGGFDQEELPMIRWRICGPEITRRTNLV